MPDTHEIVPQKDPPQPAPQAPHPVAAEPDVSAAEHMAGYLPGGQRQFDLASADPMDSAGELTHVDRALRAPILTRLGQQVGNRSVQRLMRQVQRARASGPAAAADTRLADRIAAGSRAGGQPLDPGVAQAVGGTLGAEVDGVRVHTGSEADALARDLDALAFTTGADIFVSADAPDLNSAAGQHLLAHEAAHTVQQASGPVAGTPLAGGVSVSDPGDQFERAAESTASAALRPSSSVAAAPRTLPALSLSSAPMVQRYPGDGSEALPLDDKPAEETEPDAEEEEVERTITIDEVGVTTAVYNKPGFVTKDEVVTQTAGTKPEENLVDVKGKVVATFKVTTSVNLPSVPSDLSACQKKRVEDAIKNQLSPHEDAHVAAMKGYDGTQEAEISVSRVARANAIAELTKVAQTKADEMQAEREAAAQKASDALDNPPFVINVDLNCKDEKKKEEKKPDKKSSSSEGMAGEES